MSAENELRQDFFSKRSRIISSCLSQSLIFVLVLFFITACSEDNTKVELTGQVDRNLPAGMTVCVDSSGNGKCDPDEPSARTNVDGTYSVSIPAESLGQFPLVVEPDNKKKDTVIHLTAPAGKHEFVSQVSTAVQSRVYQGSSLAEAEADVRTRYAVPDDIDLYADYQESSADPEAVQALIAAVDEVAADSGFDVANSEEPAEVVADAQRVVVRRVSRASAATSSDNGVVEEVAGSSSSAVSAVDSGSVTPGSTVVAVTEERSVSAGSSGTSEENVLLSSADNR
ncbi:MAG: hypothetical protein Q3M24_21545 [Candidatus Electrothrix aestuarii]|uniref:Carboxypeptidase regulatory-like domain-containing protein n=1 Tax=Candidatus Electrothrix aestuarii TaxID=3062594 RepID=A0AAU8LVC0_9BACT|nr:hypothetical protein [Candidatus Electrothrix aestuarii]